MLNVHFIYLFGLTTQWIILELISLTGVHQKYLIAVNLGAWPHLRAHVGLDCACIF